MSNQLKVIKFLAEARIFYVLTIDGEQPKGRPFSYFTVYDDKIFFSTGTHKNIFKQIQENPHVEILAWHGNKIMRYDGIAKIVEDDELTKAVRSASPTIANEYDLRQWDFGHFYLEDGHVEIKFLLDPDEEFDL